MDIQNKILRKIMTIGIYKLVFTGTDAVYIGQSNNIELRYVSHCTSLRGGNASAKLQEAFDLYGLPTIEILIECTVDELDSLEEEAINIFDSTRKGLNTLSKFGHRSTLHGELCGNSKYSNELIIEVFMYLVTTDMKHSEIQEITGISRGALVDISSGVSHRWLEKEFPSEYAILLSKKLNRRKLSISKSKGGSKLLDKYPKVVSPGGVEYQVDILREFCRQHELNHGAFGQMLRGNVSQHKGWKIVK